MINTEKTLQIQDKLVQADLASEIEKLNVILTKLYTRNSFWHSFFRGILTGFGYAIGATIIFAVLVYLLGKINLVPVIGEWLGAIISQAVLNMSPL